MNWAVFCFLTIVVSYDLLLRLWPRLKTTLNIDTLRAFLHFLHRVVSNAARAEDVSVTNFHWLTAPLLGPIAASTAIATSAAALLSTLDQRSFALVLKDSLSLEIFKPCGINWTLAADLKVDGGTFVVFDSCSNMCYFVIIIVCFADIWRWVQLRWLWAFHLH